MQDTIRAFIAIEIDEAVRGEVSAILADLKRCVADVKWVSPENIHLTLKFLGDVKKDGIEEIKNALKVAASRAGHFNISLSEIGAFPNLNSPRVIWLGIKEGADESAKLANEIEGQLVKLGLPKENRPFSSHLTLGRIGSPKGRQELKEIIETLNKNPSPARETIKSSVKHITLFQSTLTPKGPIYTNLYEAALMPM